jgi:hypothetical protein
MRVADAKRHSIVELDRFDGDVLGVAVPPWLLDGGDFHGPTGGSSHRDITDDIGEVEAASGGELAAELKVGTLVGR